MYWTILEERTVPLRAYECDPFQGARSFLLGSFLIGQLFLNEPSDWPKNLGRGVTSFTISTLLFGRGNVSAWSTNQMAPLKKRDQ